MPIPGKQLLPGSREHFFGLKSGINDRYIYDFGLSTGEVLYSGQGGVGISDDKRIIQLHDLFKKPYAEELITEEFQTTFKGKWGKAKFQRIRRDTNIELKDPSRRTIARLYCLLASSGFTFKFDKYGNFKGEYFPHKFDITELGLNRLKLINSDFHLIHGNFRKFDLNLLTKKSLVYYHVPFPWPVPKKTELFEFFNKLDERGTDFLISGRVVNRTMTDETMLNWSKNYSSIVFEKFTFSDIFITNF